jgi:hypothetical protein
MNQQGSPRHIVQRRQYDARRYARHLTQPELDQRFRDIFVNMLRITAEAKVGLYPIIEKFEPMLERFTHVLEEFQLRHGPYPAGFTPNIFHSEPFPDFVSDLAGKAAKRLSSIGLKQGEVFIKFGKREYMQQLYESGAVRIQPATYFAQTDHAGAVRDDELRLAVSAALTREDIIKFVRNPQDVPANMPEQRIDLSFESPTDYWLYCVTNSVEPRLFVDFNADSCVIIRDREKFSQMLREAARKHLDTATMHNCPAVYVDPLLPPTAEIFVPLVKHFRYTYQDEYRFCWLPSAPVQRVAYLDVQIGSLKDISDLIIL